MKEIVLNRIQKPSPNYKKFSALVDDEDFESINKYNWNVHITENNFYAASFINGKYILLHNFIMGFKGVDHKNCNGLDNQRANLRKANQSQNMANIRKMKNASSKYKGVSWYKIYGKWEAYIKKDYKNIRLGYFASETEAAQAYNKKATELFGEFAKLNTL